MQQKKAAESTRESETRLEKRRQAAKKITAEGRSKQSECQRVYQQQKKKRQEVAGLSYYPYLHIFVQLTCIFTV